MKNLITSFLFFITVLSVQAQVQIAGGGDVQPTGNYAAMQYQFIRGATQYPADTVQRNNIASYLRVDGMLAYVTSTKETWQLQGGIDNSNWVKPAYGDDVDLSGYYTKAQVDSIQAAIIAGIPDISGKEDKTNKGQADGYASLDGSGKIPTSQLPDAILGSVNYRGSWDAGINDPTLPTPTASNKGYYYVVNIPGTQFGIEYKVGDWAISNGSEWQKVDNNNSVTSVFGRVGAVDITPADLGLSASNQVPFRGGDGLFKPKLFTTLPTAATIAERNSTGALAVNNATNNNEAVPLGQANINYIQNQAAVAQAANFRISGGGTFGGGVTATGAGSFGNSLSITAPTIPNNGLRINAYARIFGDSNHFIFGHNVTSSSTIDNIRAVYPISSTGYFGSYIHMGTNNAPYRNGINFGTGVPVTDIATDYTIASTTKMRLTHAGNLLINTLTDNETDKLQVNGTISASAASTTNQVVIKSQLDTKANDADVLHKSGNETFTGIKTSTDEVDVLNIGNRTVQTLNDNGGEIRIRGNSVSFSAAGGPLTHVIGSNDIGEDEIQLELPHLAGKLARIQDIPSPVDISGKANTDGSNATGTWPISISGNAGSWAGLNADFSGAGTSLDYFIGWQDDGRGGSYFTKEQARVALGIPSGGETLQSVTDRGNSITTSSAQMLSFNSTNANGGYFTGQSSGTPVWDIGTSKQVFNTGSNTDFGLNSRTGFLGLGTNNTERLRITSTGNVGIGTDSPTAKLHVDGNVLIEGDLTITSSASSVDINSDVDLNGFTIKNLLEPIDIDDAATKGYVDEAAGKSRVDTISSNYTLQSTDAGAILLFDNDAQLAVSSATNGLPVGTRVTLIQTKEQGYLNVTDDVGVYVRKYADVVGKEEARQQWGVATLLKVSADTWVLHGDLFDPL